MVWNGGVGIEEGDHGLMARNGMIKTLAEKDIMYLNIYLHLLKSLIKQNSHEFNGYWNDITIKYFIPYA